MILKLRAALDARRDPDFVIVARTDARAVEGFDAAVERANLYGEAGADVCFIEAPQSRGELEGIPRAVRRPLLVNMLTGGATPILPVDDLEGLGYKIVVCPIETLLAAGAAVRRVIDALLTRGRADLPAGEMLTFAQVKQVLQLDEVLGLRDKLENR
jgi:2-methylisocitrate lyase-like PEP mutase family enzyme